MKRNRSGTRVHRNWSQTTAFDVIHFPTMLLRAEVNFAKLFVEGAAKFDENLLVEFA